LAGYVAILDDKLREDNSLRTLPGTGPTKPELVARMMLWASKGFLNSIFFNPKYLF